MVTVSYDNQDNLIMNSSTLTVVAIEASVTHLPDNMFSGCSNLHRVYNYAAPSVLTNVTFSGCPNPTISNMGKEREVQKVVPEPPVEEFKQTTPVQPVQPIQPVQPVQSVQPVQPVQPVRSVQPVQPAQSTGITLNIPIGAVYYSIHPDRRELYGTTKEAAVTNFLRENPKRLIL